MRVAVLCTGGVALGYGHFFRSLAFAGAAPTGVDANIYAVIAPADRRLLDGVPKAAGFDTAEEVVQSVLADQPDVVVWDTLDWPDAAFAILRSTVSLHVSISPVFRHMRHMQMLFARNVATPDVPGVTVHRGLAYALVGGACRPIPDRAYEETLQRAPLTVAVSMGGGDAANRTQAVLGALAEVPNPLLIWALLGEGYQHSFEGLVDAVGRNRPHELILAKTTRSLWSVLAQASVAVLAGGVMMVEAAYAGLPSFILFERALHADAAGRELFERGASLDLGAFGPDALAALTATVDACWQDRQRLRDMRAASHGCVDGRAAERVYAHLREAWGT
jgi:spore coat polysaccharide biosynthesis predicted glycosyltransferase SpsG